MMDEKLIVGAAVGFVTFLAGWMLHLIRDREQDDIMSETVPRETNKIAIQAMINARWKLQAEIMDCNFLSHMECLGMQIIFFEDQFYEEVPFRLLQQHVSELKTYYNKKYQILENHL
jgi:hypothetical protein